jgi:hypothetical protein
MLFVFAIALGIYLLWSLCTGTLHGTGRGRLKGWVRVYRSESPMQYWAAFVWFCFIDTIFFFAAFRHYRY